MSLYMGIDTSNYTTSVATVGDCQINTRKIIDIKEGMRGIRQSDGVFVHLKELPELFDTLEIDTKRISGIGVSVTPRRCEGSYMPVFLAGESFARVIAKTLGVPLYRYSHQEGHIMAGILSGGFYELLEKPFLAVHLSGGTTEILKCEYKNYHFETEIVGGTLDISAGQLIDRLGVRLGMKFPCGKEMDKICRECKDKPIKLKTSINGAYMNFSGMETRLLEMAETYDAGLLSKSALTFIGESLAKAINSLDCCDVLFVGGVASNSLLRSYLKEKLSANVYFATPELSCDNGVGIAELARREHNKL